MEEWVPDTVYNNENFIINRMAVQLPVEQSCTKNKYYENRSDSGNRNKKCYRKLLF